jgi:NAD(P)H-hydrate epimerase
MKLVTSASMREIDHITIHDRGIPGPQLMENAGRGIAEGILSDVIENPESAKVAVFCGKGNNGGDGFVVARYLKEAGANVSIFFLGPADGLSDNARLNLDRIDRTAISLNEIKSIDDLPDTLECDFIVDAVFGTGFSGAPRGLAAEMIEYIDLQDAEIIAVDLPSGLDADTGQAEGAVTEADHTYTLALPKYGLYVTPGRELSGTVTTVPIGVPDNVIESVGLKDELITPETVIDLLPYRKPDAHKGNFGRLFVLAGSVGMTGAAAMTAEAANRTGCGLIKLGCPRMAQPVLATKLTEVMTCPLPDVAKKGVLALRSLGEIRSFVDQHDAVVVGPGMGTHHETKELVRRLLSNLNKPTIVDADGLNNLAGATDIIKECPSPLVLTPHPGEFARLTGEEAPPDYRDKADMVRKAAAEFNAVIVFKGSPTLVADPDGLCYFNQTGNSGMATGGSGDVLSGMIGSFLAQGMRPIDASICAVFIHGLAGDLAAEELTERALVAGDIIRYLPVAFDLLDGM